MIDLFDGKKTYIVHGDEKIEILPLHQSIEYRYSGNMKANLEFEYSSFQNCENKLIIEDIEV